MVVDSVLRRMTRRQFLKTAAAGAAVVAVSDRLAGGGASSLTPVPVSAATGTTVKYGWCRMCHRSYCSTVDTIQDGVVTNITGDLRNPWNEGRLCVRGNSAINFLYNPYRVKSPMKRTNPSKGFDQDPKWVEISWDEAYDTIAGKLVPIKKSDPRKFVYISGFGADYTYLDKLFASAFGTPNGTGATGAMCSVHWAPGQTHGVGIEQVDPGYCNYVISIGNSLALNTGPAEPSGRDIADAMVRGMKMVIVDPRCSVEASKGEWVPIRPGTELAFLLAMENVILNELGTYDVWFLKNRSNGPYLIGPDGYYVRDAASKKPMLWDPTDSKAKVFDDPTIKDYALEGTFSVGSVQAQPAFALLKAQVKQNTPEWQEAITSIPAATVRRLSKELVENAQIGSTINIGGTSFPFRPAAITARRGVSSHYQGQLAYWTAMVINTLIGAMDVPGGDNGNTPGPMLKPDVDGTVSEPVAGLGVQNAWKFPPAGIDAASLYPYGFSQGHRLARTILEPAKYGLDYSPEAIMHFGHNYYSKAAADFENLNEAWRKIPFSISIAYHFDEHAAFADVILPECSVLERTLTNSLTGAGRKFWSLARTNYIGQLAQTPVVPPLYQSKAGDVILLELSDKLGCLTSKPGLNDFVNRSLGADYKLDTDKKYTIDEIVDRSLKTTYGADKGLAYFKDTSFIAIPVKPAEVFAYFYHPGNKTRHPIYNMRLKAAGDTLLANLKKANFKHPAWSEETIAKQYTAIPSWNPGATMNPPAGFDLFGVVWKIPPFLFDISNTNSNPFLQEIATSDENFGKLLMNSKTAASKGFKDGDMAYVEGQFGGKIGPFPIKTTERVHPDVLGCVSGLARSAPGMNPITSNGIPFNRLLSNREDVLEVITASIELSPRVKVTKT